jgi:tRNA dimethylallyltransferase
MSVRAVLLLGPTGAGKTDLALRLEERLPLEIVSMDSVLVYRGLDIGTAKPSRAIREHVTHHLIDICDASERYSVADFLRDAALVMTAIHARGKIPLLVGGTMLYCRALQSGLADLPPANTSVRAQLQARASADGWPALHGELMRVDPAAGARIQPLDQQRIQRALEVYMLTGRPLSDVQRENVKGAVRADYLKLILAPRERARLSAGLATRFDAMLQAGLVDEVGRLRTRAELDLSLPALRAVGYRQVWGHLAGEYDLAEARRLSIAATLALAKRQYTWLRAEANTTWEELRPGLLETWVTLIEKWNCGTAT